MDRSEDWKEREQQYLEHWQRIEKTCPIKWLARDNFWQIYTRAYAAKQRYLDHDVELSMALPQLRARIQMAPVYTPFDDEFQVPVERWYGQLDEHLLMLTHYYIQDYPALNKVCYEQSSIATQEIDAALRVFKSLSPLMVSDRRSSGVD